MEQYLIADSGGTKTDWCYVDTDEKSHFFSTNSYHPEQWNSAFFEKSKLFWEEFGELGEIKLYFFGAGCYFVEKCEKLVQFFKSLGFQSVSIFSDLHGSAIASFGKANGKVAIMGTGSVVFHWKNEQIENIIGGKGHLIGDEGSGYYFGKLILEAIKNRELSSLQLKTIERKVPTTIDLSNKYEVAKISYLLKDDKDLFFFFHRQNIIQFITSHNLQFDSNKIAIVGSYAFHHQDIIRSVFEEKGVEISTFIEKPIYQLVEQKHVFVD